MIMSSSKLSFIAVCSLYNHVSRENFAAAHLLFRQTALTFHLPGRVKVFFRKRYQNCLQNYYLELQKIVKI